MASAVIGALRVNLGINTAQFNESIEGVRAAFNRAGRQMQQWGGRLSTYVTAPISLAGAAVTAAVTTMARDVEDLQKSAQVANAGFESFQRLAHAARSVGIESDKLADIYKDVNDRVGDFVATGGGPMADFFENIAPKVGITAEAFKDLSGPQALQLYYDSLVKAGASQQDMTFYLEAMASDATALIPLLRDGGKAFDELGRGAAVLTEQDAAKLQEYNAAMRQMGEAIKSVTIALVNSGILTTITGIVERAAEWTAALAETNPAIVKWGVVIAGLAAAIGPALIGLGVMATTVAALSAPVLAVVAAIGALAAAWVFWDDIKASFPVTASIIESVLTMIGQNFKLLMENVGLFVQYFKQVFTGDFRAAGETVKQIAMNIGQMILNVFKALPDQMVQVGKDILQGLWDGMKSMGGAVVEGAKNIGSNIISGVKGIFNSHSPSRVMMGIGRDVMSGLGIGMDNMSGQVEGIATNISSTVSSAFHGLIDGTKTVKDVLSDLLSNLSRVWMDQAFQAILGGGVGGAAKGGGGLLGGIGSFFSSILGFARGGTILPGGAGGIDSQLVMFRKSPNERVDITKPGQTLGGGAMDVRVYVDENGNWQAKVADIADGRVRRAAPQIVGTAVNRSRDTVVPTVGQYQRDRAGGDYRLG